MKRMYVVLLSLLFLFTSLFSIGCASQEPFDASGYVRALLDATTRGEFTEYLQFTNSTEEEAQAEYDAILDAFFGALSDLELSDEKQTMFADVFQSLLALTRYNVLPAEQDESGSFTVQVEVEQLMLFSGLGQWIEDRTAEYLAQIIEAMDAGGEAPTDADFYTWIYQAMLEYFQDQVTNPTYGPKEVVTVTVTQGEDGLYQISAADTDNLFGALLDVSPEM